MHHHMPVKYFMAASKFQANYFVALGIPQAVHSIVYNVVIFHHSQPGKGDPDKSMSFDARLNGSYAMRIPHNALETAHAHQSFV